MPSRRPFSNPEFAKIDSLSDSRTKVLLLCGALTGFRISELLSWRKRDLFDGNEIRDSVTVDAAFMKNKSHSRTVKLHRSVKAILLRTIPSSGLPEQYIFRSREGINKAICVDTANRNIKKMCAVNGISNRIGTHSMRKTYAKLLYKASGNDIMAVKQALGHKDVRTTQRYLELEEGRLDALMDVLW
jgi:integrase